MDKEWKESMLFPRFIPMYLNDNLNEEIWKANGTISDESVHEDTPIYRNGMHMRNRKDVMTCVQHPDPRPNWALGFGPTTRPMTPTSFCLRPGP